MGHTLEKLTIYAKYINFLYFKWCVSKTGCEKKVLGSGLFLRKSAATVFNNKIELFEKAEGQGPVVFRLLGFRFLGYEKPPEMLKWEYLTINKHSSNS